jgi:hypothetical protein
MQERTKVFQREELYERVWTTPMRKLAREFKYSDVGLAKLCRKHGVPTPGIGYWRKVELGHKPPREPLPTIARNGPYTIHLTLRDPAEEEQKPIPQEVPVISVAFDALLSHPAVIRSERLLRTARKDDKDLLVARKGSVEHLQVTEAQLSRALSILDALFGALEDRNIRVIWPKDEAALLSLDGGSEKIGLCVSEILNSKPHVVTGEEEARRKRDWAWSPPKRDYQATGLLRIVLLCDETPSVRHTWSEGKRKKKIEESLGEVVAGIEPLVLAIRKVKADRQRWHDELAAEQRRREEARRQHEEFVRKGGIITKAAEALRQSQIVRRFVISVGNSPELHELDTDCLQRMQELLAWCTKYADRIDPTCHLDELLRNFEKPKSWHDP